MTTFDVTALMGLTAIVFYFLGLYTGCSIELGPLKASGAVTMSRRRGTFGRDD